MATFDPAVQIGYGTSFTADAGRKVVIAEDGTVTVMNYFGSDVFTAKIECPTATDAERSYIESFYETNKNLAWTFLHPGDGNTYTLFFTNRPNVSRVESLGNPIFGITIDAIGYRA